MLILSGGAMLVISGRAVACRNNSNILWHEIFHNRGPMFDSNSQPAPNSVVTLTLRVCYHDITSANVLYYGAANATVIWVPMSRSSTDSSGKFDDWQGTISDVGTAALYYRFQISHKLATVWYTAAGISSSEPTYDFFIDIPGFKMPGWTRHGVGNKIFPHRFYDGDPENDTYNGELTYAGCATEQHSRVSGYTSGAAYVNGCDSEVFFGGEPAGISQQLRCIKKTLGTNIIYRTPIFESPINHKCDTVSYYKVNRALGTNSTLKRLIRAIHNGERGRRGCIILDGLFNHTGDMNCWSGRYTDWKEECRPAGAFQSQSSSYYDCYRLQGWPTRCERGRIPWGETRAIGASHGNCRAAGRAGAQPVARSGLAGARISI